MAAQSRRTYYGSTSELQKQARGFETLRRANSFQGFAALPDRDIDLRCGKLNPVAIFYIRHAQFSNKNPVFVSSRPNPSQP